MAHTENWKKKLVTHLVSLPHLSTNWQIPNMEFSVKGNSDQSILLL